MKVSIMAFAVLATLALSGGACFTHQRLNLGTGTPYPEPIAVYSASSDKCEVIHINHIGRHGSRHLTKDRTIRLIKQEMNHAQINGALTGKMAQELGVWINEVSAIEIEEVLGKITNLGRSEQRGLGVRMYYSYRQLFDKASAIKKPVITSVTSIERTTESRDAFLQGLTSLAGPELQIIEEAPGGDCDIRFKFNNYCGKFNRMLDSKSWINEGILFAGKSENMTVFNVVLKSIFSEIYVDTMHIKKKLEFLESLHKLCAFDANFGGRDDRFCRFFNAQSLELMAVYQNINSFHMYGLVKRMSCVLLRDFLEAGDFAVKNSEKAPAANLRFAHAETVIPFRFLLEDFGKKMDSRWRTNVISPMAANIKWVLYRCLNSSYKVKLFYNENEQPFPIAGCDVAGCDWEKVRDFYLPLSCSKTEWASKKICGDMVGCKAD